MKPATDLTNPEILAAAEGEITATYRRRVAEYDAKIKAEQRPYELDKLQRQRAGLDIWRDSQLGIVRARAAKQAEMAADVVAMREQQAAAQRAQVRDEISRLYPALTGAALENAVTTALQQQAAAALAAPRRSTVTL